MKIKRLSALLLLTAFLSGMFTMGSEAFAAVTYSATELFVRPTDTSITVNIVPNDNGQVYFKYGTTPGNYASQTGPPGGVETTYSFDYGNSHFIVLNEYYNGSSDTGTDGDVVDALYNWLVADLNATDRSHIFVF